MDIINYAFIITKDCDKATCCSKGFGLIFDLPQRWIEHKKCCLTYFGRFVIPMYPMVRYFKNIVLSSGLLCGVARNVSYA